MADGQTWCIPADKQTAFDRVWWHLRAQRKQALSLSGNCCYLAPDGCKCAIGAFIPDGHPAQGFVGDAYDLCSRYPELFEPGSSLVFLRSLQKAHDLAADDRFRARLELVAHQNDLTTPLQRGEKGPKS